MSREFDALLKLAPESRLPLKKAQHLFHGSPALRTIQRYVSQGMYCISLRKRIFLEAYRGTGNSYITSVEAVRRFNARINGGEE